MCARDILVKWGFETDAVDFVCKNIALPPNNGTTIWKCVKCKNENPRTDFLKSGSSVYCADGAKREFYCLKHFDPDFFFTYPVGDFIPMGEKPHTKAGVLDTKLPMKCIENYSIDALADAAEAAEPNPEFKFPFRSTEIITEGYEPIFVTDGSGDTFINQANFGSILDDLKLDVDSFSQFAAEREAMQKRDFFPSKKETETLEPQLPVEQGTDFF